jgi:hypothetical protein
MFIPIIVLSKDCDNDSSMGGVDEEFNNWSLDLERVVELFISSHIFYKKKKKENNNN